MAALEDKVAIFLFSTLEDDGWALRYPIVLHKDMSGFVKSLFALLLLMSIFDSSLSSE